MQLLVEQLDRRVAELSRWLEAEVGPPAEVRLVRGVGDEARLPDFDDRQAPVLAPDGDWREALNSTVWLRFRARRPDSWPVADTALIAQRFGTYPIESERRIGLNLQRMQGMLYVDGRAYHGLDQYHRLIYLPPGPDYQCAASVWTGFADLDSETMFATWVDTGGVANKPLDVLEGPDGKLYVSTFTAIWRFSKAP